MVLNPHPLPWLERRASSEVVDPSTVGEIKAGLAVIRSGPSRGRAHDVALGLVLSETDLLGKAFGPGARRLARALQREAQTLPPAALAIVDTFRERRRREDRIGTWYADE